MKAMKRPAILLLVITIIFFTIPTAQAALTLEGFQPYPDDYYWSAPVDQLPVHPLSDTYISKSNSSAFIYFGRLHPINVVTAAQKRQKLSSFTFPQYSDDIPYPIPDVPIVQGNDDLHLVIVSPETNELFEFFEFNKNPDGTYRAFIGVRFNLSSYDLRPNGTFSADMSGQAILPGLIRFDEVESGVINHATRISINTTSHDWIWPARGDGVVDSPDYPPPGQRFRLKASFNTSGYSPHMLTIVNSWKKYGLIVSDNNGLPGLWTLFGEETPKWDTMPDVNFSFFKNNLHASDFEAVDSTSLMIDEDSGQAKIPHVFSPTSTPSISNQLTRGSFRDDVSFLNLFTNCFFKNKCFFGLF